MKAKLTDLQRAQWRAKCKTALEALAIAAAYAICLVMMLRSFRPKY